MLYTIIKALHIIFMVSYFAGIFYLVRIFVYYKDTDEFPEEKKENSKGAVHVYGQKAVEYYHRSCRSNHGSMRIGYDFFKSWAYEDGMVPFKTHFPDRACYLSLLVLEKKC